MKIFFLKNINPLSSLFLFTILFIGCNETRKEYVIHDDALRIPLTSYETYFIENSSGFNVDYETAKDYKQIIWRENDYIYLASESKVLIAYELENTTQKITKGPWSNKTVIESGILNIEIQHWPDPKDRTKDFDTYIKLNDNKRTGHFFGNQGNDVKREKYEWEATAKKINIPDDILKEMYFLHTRRSNDGGQNFDYATDNWHKIKIDGDRLLISEQKGTIQYKIITSPKREMDSYLNNTFYTFKVVNNFGVESTLRYYDGDQFGLIQYWGNNYAEWFLF